MFTDKTILVTGGAGFIGGHIIERCLKENAKKVISYDNMCGSKNDNLSHLRNNPHFSSRLVEIEGDICDYEKIKPFVEEADIIFNNAASKLVVSLHDPSIDVKTNVLGNFGILEIMRKCNSQARIIHASTGSVFGSSEKPFDENDPMHPSTVYGISKLAAEKYFLLYAKEYGIKATVLRYYHVFGPRQDYAGEAGVINIFLSQVLHGKSPTVCGKGEQIRCFTYVKDVVEANILLTQNSETIGKSYNIASKTRMSILELANKVIEKYGPLGMIPEMITHRQGENLKPIPDTSRIEAIGFKEKTSFEEGLTLTKRWIEEDIKNKEINSGLNNEKIN